MVDVQKKKEKLEIDKKKKEEELQEQTIQKKSIELAKMIKQAKYPIVFTGAGCSTSIGIPDYRSGN